MKDASGGCLSVLQLLVSFPLSCTEGLEATVQESSVLHNQICAYVIVFVCAGRNYPDNWLQVYNIQCPANQLLHLFMLSLDTERNDINQCDTTQ